MVLLSPDFKCKVDSFNLYIIDNYVKRTIGRRIPCSLTVLFLLFYNLITVRGHLPTKIKSQGGGLGIYTDRDQRDIFLGFEFRKSVLFFGYWS